MNTFDTNAPLYKIGDTVQLVLGVDRTFSDHDEAGEVIDTGVQVDDANLEVVSSDWNGSTWVYNLRNDDGLRVWGVDEDSLDGDR